MSESKYPMIDLSVKTMAFSQEIERFIGWLHSQKQIDLFQVDDEHQPVQGLYSKQELVAEFFGIDLSQLEDERAQMLEDFVARTQAAQGDK